MFSAQSKDDAAACETVRISSSVALVLVSLVPQEVLVNLFVETLCGL